MPTSASEPLTWRGKNWIKIKCRLELVSDKLGQVRNVLLILAITAAMAIATTALTFVFDLVPGATTASAIPKG